MNEESTGGQIHAGLRLRERYVLERQVARGALCAVYRGRDEVLPHPVAVKAVPPAHVPAYRAALHATAALTHPAVVIVLDAIEHDGWLFLVQEYVESGPLAALLQTGLSPEHALELAQHLGRCLAYAHQHRVVHGDVTPGAVLAERGGLVRLNNFALPPDAAYFEAYDDLDVRLARLLDLAMLGPAGAEDGAAAEADAAGDVRAVGLLLWQALASPGRSGQRGDFRADVPAPLRELVGRLVVRAHPRRLRTADELCAEVKDLARLIGALQDDEPQPTPAPLRAARTPLDPAVAGAAGRAFYEAPTWGDAATPPTGGPPPAGASGYDPAALGAARSGPLTGGPARPPSGTPSRPLTGTPSRPLTGTPSRPLTGTPSRPLGAPAPSWSPPGAPPPGAAEPPAWPLPPPFPPGTDPRDPRPSGPRTGGPSRPLGTSDPRTGGPSRPLGPSAPPGPWPAGPSAPLAGTRVPALPRAGNTSGPLRAGPPSGPLAAPYGADWPARAPVAGPLRAPSAADGMWSTSPVPRGARPSSPLAAEDVPSWATADTRGRSLGRRSAGAARGGPAFGVVPVVAVGILLFVVCFVLGYFLPALVAGR